MKNPTLFLQIIEEYDIPFEANFEDVSHLRKSTAWKHFMYDKIRKIAKCNYCGKILRSYGSTMTLQRHLKTHENSAKM